MASGTRTKSKSAPSRLVLSDVHVDHPCKECYLCKEKHVVYTHPMKWKNQSLVAFVRDVEPSVGTNSCICRTCRADIASGQRDPDNYHPRWSQLSQLTHKLCEVPGCVTHACRSTKLGDRELLSDILNCTAATTSGQTNLCGSHYRVLHKELNPGQYQRNCAICASPINPPSCRTCSEHEIISLATSKSTLTSPALCHPTQEYAWPATDTI